MDPPVTRTTDVEITENVPFSKMLLSDHVLAGLNKCGFQHPSPIQLRAIPIGCCGLGLFDSFIRLYWIIDSEFLFLSDLLVKAKSGTGKTLVFCTLILEKYEADIKAPQSLVVVPTREIAEQIKCYLNDIGATSPGAYQQCEQRSRNVQWNWFIDLLQVSKRLVSSVVWT